jgi:hypothetical protein
MSIDFVSSRNGIDAQSQRCAQLIAAVIAQAVKDLTLKPIPQERKNRMNIDPNAIRSILFFKSNTFLRYADLIGMDGEDFIKHARLGNISERHISEADVRAMRARLRWRCEANVTPHPTLEEDIADEEAWVEEERIAKEKADAKRKDSDRKSGQHAVDIDRVHRIHEAGRDKVDTQVSPAKRRNAKAPRA